MNDTRKTIPILVRAPEEDVKRFDARLKPNQSRQSALKVFIHDFGQGDIEITEPKAVLVKEATASANAGEAA